MITIVRIYLQDEIWMGLYIILNTIEMFTGSKVSGIKFYDSLKKGYTVFYFKLAFVMIVVYYNFIHSYKIKDIDIF